jgi:hypothetical protein
MADVRSLLRSELASRAATSPAVSGRTQTTRKRRLETYDDTVRKKSRGDVQTPGQWSSLGAEPSPPPSTKEIVQDEEEEQKIKRPSSGEATESSSSPGESGGVEDDVLVESKKAAPLAPADSVQTQTQTIDEDEWAAFEREVVAPTRIPYIPAAAMAVPTISAAPVSAKELAAQQRKEREELAKAREADIEGDKEDATRLLEEEFDEMAQLEERVRRLKERREELRKRTGDESQRHSAATGPNLPASADVERQYREESESDGEGEDWDDWRFR